MSNCSDMISRVAIREINANPRMISPKSSQQFDKKPGCER